MAAAAITRVPRAIILNGGNAAATRGSAALDVFLDLQCPFSRKAWCTLRQIDNADVEIRAFLYIQTWHGNSYALTKAAAAVLGHDMNAGIEFIDHIYADQKPYADDDSQPNNALYELLQPVAVKLGMSADAFRREVSADLGHSGYATKYIKYATKLGRQNGVHSTPTFLVNGIENTSASSSWTLEQWGDLISESQ